MRRALEERRERLKRTPKIPEANVAERLALLDRLRDSLALTQEQTDAWVAEVAAERRATNPPGFEG